MTLTFQLVPPPPVILNLTVQDLPLASDFQTELFVNAKQWKDVTLHPEITWRPHH